MLRHCSSLLTRHLKVLQNPLIAGAITLAILTNAQAQTVATPESVLGFRPATARKIADWEQIVGYFHRLDEGSERIAVREIGKSTLGQPMIAAFISDPANIKDLDMYRAISAKLADPRTVSGDAELRELLRKGKTIVSISCSIHSTEIVASQMSMNLAHELATAEDEDTREILRNVILILIPSSNPDGLNVVANWYRKTLGTKAEGSAPPELYHPYAGHDNNRDWFMLNLAESRNITDLYWKNWFPQIVYDVHQMGQTGARMILPPFFDPPNPRIDPLLLREVGLIGYKMASDLEMEGFAGAATNSTFDTWWHGGFRTAPYYHNSIGILTEAASADLMTPINVSSEQLKANRGARGLNSPLEAQTSHPDPWTGDRLWGPENIAAMEMTTSRALLEIASKFRARYLENFHALSKAGLEPKSGDPVAFVIPAGQPNGETVSRMIEILIAQGVEVHRMTEEGHFKLSKGVKEFSETPLGSIFIPVNQPQRANVLSLFERQVYPNRLNPSGEAEVPYDVAGWTLPLQMGIEYETVWEIGDREAWSKSLKKVDKINDVRVMLNLKPSSAPFSKLPNPLKNPSRVGLYRGYTGSMDEGWTRLVLDLHQIKYKTISDSEFRGGDFGVDTIILPADSESSIVRGLSSARYPEELSGGIGDQGVSNLKRFVEGGGRLICFDDSCGLVIKTFGLPVKNVLNGLKRNEFYNPGSVVNLSVDQKHPLAAGIASELPAYFINSSAFEVGDASSVRTVASYAKENALLSGWMLGESRLNGKAALVETTYGKGQIVMFAFRPQHRGQTFATFPLIFNALEK